MPRKYARKRKRAKRTGGLSTNVVRAQCLVQDRTLVKLKYTTGINVSGGSVVLPYAAKLTQINSAFAAVTGALPATGWKKWFAFYNYSTVNACKAKYTICNGDIYPYYITVWPSITSTLPGSVDISELPRAVNWIAGNATGNKAITIRKVMYSVKEIYSSEIAIFDNNNRAFSEVLTQSVPCGNGVFVFIQVKNVGASSLTNPNPLNLTMELELTQYVSYDILLATQYI
jgi:hypothetical protein